MMNNNDVNSRQQQSTKENSQTIVNSSTKILNSLFPTVIIFIVMVGIVIVTTMIMGYKILSLENERSEVESLRVRYESYEKITMDLKEKEIRLGELMVEVPNLEARRNKAEEEYARYVQNLIVADSTLQRTRKKKNEIEASYMAKQEQLGELTADIGSSQKREIELISTVSRLTAEYNNLTTELQQLKDELSSKKQELSGIKSQIELQKQQLQELSAADLEFDLILSDLSEISGELKQAKDQAELTIGSWTNTFPKYESVINSLSTMSEELNLTQVNLESVSKSISSTSKNLSFSYDNINESEELIRSTSTSLAHVNSDVIALLGMIQQTEDALATFEQVASGNTKNLSDNHTMMLSKYTIVDRNMEDVLIQLESITSSIISRIDDINKRQTELESQMNEYKKVLKEATDELQDKND